METSEKFQEFRERVLNEPAILGRLRTTASGPEFVQACVAEAHEMGIELAPGEIESALTLARREWIERWVQ
jgi:N-acetylglutamate synthase-like GNAT family acetyltransferase